MKSSLSKRTNELESIDLMPISPQKLQDMGKITEPKYSRRPLILKTDIKYAIKSGEKTRDIMPVAKNLVGGRLYWTAYYTGKNNVVFV